MAPLSRILENDLGLLSATGCVVLAVAAELMGLHAAAVWYVAGGMLALISWRARG